MAVDTRQEKILIVDDEPVIRNILSRSLVKEGYECSEVSDSQKVLDSIECEKPDLVILDIMMPGKSGRELLPDISAQYPHLGVIMVTAVAEPFVIIECMKLGAHDYITKPLNLEEVVASVDTTLKAKQLEQTLATYHNQLEHTVEDQKKEIRKIFLGSIESLVNALEAKDEYTAGHTRRVTDFAVAIGERMGLSEGDLEDLKWGSLLHDVGKVAIDPAIQNKPGRLTSDEYHYMMTHARVGAGIVKPVATERMIEIIIYHHTRYDGSGFEQTVRGDDIPIGARIVTVADSYDAMTSNRPYRSALSQEEAINELKKESGTQFDPEIVNIFLGLIFNKRESVCIHTMDTTDIKS